MGHGDGFEPCECRQFYLANSTSTWFEHLIECEQCQEAAMRARSTGGALRDNELCPIGRKFRKMYFKNDGGVPHSRYTWDSTPSVKRQFVLKDAGLDEQWFGTDWEGLPQDVRAKLATHLRKETKNAMELNRGDRVRSKDGKERGEIEDIGTETARVMWDEWDQPAYVKISEIELENSQASAGDDCPKCEKPGLKERRDGVAFCAECGWEDVKENVEKTDTDCGRCGKPVETFGPGQMVPAFCRECSFAMSKEKGNVGKHGELEEDDKVKCPNCGTVQTFGAMLSYGACKNPKCDFQVTDYTVGMGLPRANSSPAVCYILDNPGHGSKAPPATKYAEFKNPNGALGTATGAGAICDACAEKFKAEIKSIRPYSQNENAASYTPKVGLYIRSASGNVGKITRTYMDGKHKVFHIRWDDGTNSDLQEKEMYGREATQKEINKAFFYPEERNSSPDCLLCKGKGLDPVRGGPCPECCGDDEPLYSQLISMNAAFKCPDCGSTDRNEKVGNLLVHCPKCGEHMTGNTPRRCGKCSHVENSNSSASDFEHHVHICPICDWKVEREGLCDEGKRLHDKFMNEPDGNARMLERRNAFGEWLSRGDEKAHVVSGDVDFYSGNPLVLSSSTKYSTTGDAVASLQKDGWKLENSNSSGSFQCRHCGEEVLVLSDLSAADLKQRLSDHLKDCSPEKSGDPRSQFKLMNASHICECEQDRCNHPAGCLGSGRPECTGFDGKVYCVDCWGRLPEEMKNAGDLSSLAKQLYAEVIKPNGYNESYAQDFAVAHGVDPDFLNDALFKLPEMKNASTDDLAFLCKDCPYGTDSKEEAQAHMRDKKHAIGPNPGKQNADASKREIELRKRLGKAIDSGTAPDPSDLKAWDAWVAKQKLGNAAGVGYCQGCGRETGPFTPLQDPQNPTMRGAVRWLCEPCVPGWEREGWSKTLANAVEGDDKAAIERDVVEESGAINLYEGQKDHAQPEVAAVLDEVIKDERDHVVKFQQLLAGRKENAAPFKRGDKVMCQYDEVDPSKEHGGVVVELGSDGKFYTVNFGGTMKLCRPDEMRLANAVENSSDQCEACGHYSSDHSGEGCTKCACPRDRNGAKVKFNSSDAGATWDRSDLETRMEWVKLAGIDEDNVLVSWEGMTLMSRETIRRLMGFEN
jgi:hypothetical protein